MPYTIDGYCYWSNLTKPNKLSRKWGLYLNVSPKALKKFKKEGIIQESAEYIAQKRLQA